MIRDWWMNLFAVSVFIHREVWSSLKVEILALSPKAIPITDSSRKFY